MIRINLIPPEFAAAQQKKEQNILVGTFGGAIAGVLLLFWALKVAQAKGLESKIIQSEATLRSYQAIVDQIKEIEDKKQKLISKRDVILGLNRSRLSYPVFFEDLLPLIPSDVWVTEVRFEKSNGAASDYRLSSRALSNFALATWLTNLQQSTHFSNVKLDRISYESGAGDREGQSTLNFILTFTYQHQGPMPLTEAN